MAALVAAESAVAFDPYQPYRKVLLSPERVRALSELRPLIPIVDAMICWLCIFAVWAAVSRWPQWWAAFLAIGVVANRYYALLIIGHDGIHRRSFSSPRWNDWFADLLVFGPVAAVTRIHNLNHLAHHHDLATPVDPDLHQFTCTNKYRWHLFLGYLSGVTSLLRSFKNVFIHRGKAAVSESKSRDRFALRDFAIIAVWQVALIGGLTWLIAWWAYPVLWLVPLYLAFMADNLRAFAEHSQPRPEPWANEHRLITYLSNPIERFFVAPCNMNYHAAHHLWPSIPYYNLPLADQEIRHHPDAKDLEWRGSYFAYLLRYFRLLPLEDCRPAVSEN